jgi:hypothetical protein
LIEEAPKVLNKINPAGFIGSQLKNIQDNISKPQDIENHYDPEITFE